MLLANSLASPAIGTIFWSTLIFLLFFLLLAKFAWKPILNAVKSRDEMIKGSSRDFTALRIGFHAVKSRDEMIKGSLEAAERAREDMKKLQTDNEAILRKAREERENILKEAREARDKMIIEAKDRASEEAEKLIEKARQGIEREKVKALSEIYEQVTFLSVEIASKLLGEKLKESEQQNKLIDNYLKEINFKKN